MLEVTLQRHAPRPVRGLRLLECEVTPAAGESVALQVLLKTSPVSSPSSSLPNSPRGLAQSAAARQPLEMRRPPCRGIFQERFDLEACGPFSCLGTSLAHSIATWVVMGLMLLSIALAAWLLMAKMTQADKRQVALAGPIPAGSCEECVSGGNVFQAGTCRQHCIIMDMPCKSSRRDCQYAKDLEVASHFCPTMGGCHECLLQEHCAWRKMEADCFMAAAYFGPRQHVLTRDQMDDCPPSL